MISEVGAGLQLSPNAMKVLNALGVSARVMRDALSTFMALTRG